jgi:hypothetical protein
MPVITERRTPLDEHLGAGSVITIVVVLITLMAIAWSGALTAPDHVKRLTIDNPHPWLVSVDARPAGSTSWTGIGALDPGTDQEYLELLDMGDSWELRFSYAGEVDVTMAISRRQLEASDWTVAVPSSFASEAEVAEAAGRLPARTATG